VTRPQWAAAINSRFAGSLAKEASGVIAARERENLVGRQSPVGGVISLERLGVHG
jgi:hypothetical protein